MECRKAISLFNECCAAEISIVVDMLEVLKGYKNQGRRHKNKTNLFCVQFEARKKN